MSAGLSHISDADLMRMLGEAGGSAKGAAPAKPAAESSTLAHLSDDELMRQLGASQAAQAEKPAAHPMTLADGSTPPEIGASQGQDVGALGAITRGMLNGIPVVGPAIAAGVERAAAGIGALKNGESYGDSLEQVQANSKATAEARPITTAVSELGGAVAGAAPLIALAPAAFGVSAASLPVRAGASLLTNGALGAADGAARSGSDLEATAIGGGLGAVGGLLAPYAGRAAGKVASAVASKINPAAIPGIDDLKSAARAAYQRADDAGVQIAQPSFRAAVSDISRMARVAGIDKTIHPKATAALGRFEEAAATAPTLQELEILRKVARGAAASADPDEQRVGSLLVDRLDDFLERVKPGDLVSGDADGAVAALGEARGLWGRARRAEMIDDALLRAADRAGSNVADNGLETTIRQNLRAILDSPKKRRGFSGPEIEAIRSVVRGGPIQNLARQVGRLSPEGAVGLAEFGAAAMHPSALTLGVPAAGYVAKKTAEGIQRSKVRTLGDLVRSGGELPVSPLALPAQQAVEPLAINIFSALPRLANQ